MEQVLCDVWEITAGYCLVGMVENMKDYYSDLKGQSVGGLSGIPLIQSRGVPVVCQEGDQVCHV